MFVRKKLSPYVVALYQQAVEGDVLKEIVSDAVSILAILSDAVEVQSFLKNSFIPDEEKTNFLVESHQAEFSLLMLSFVTIVAQNRRMSCFKEMLLVFLEYVDLQSGIQSIRVTSAFPLSEAVETKLRVALTEQLNGSIHLRVEVDSDLIGGIVIHYPDYELDLSIRQKIRTLKSTIKEIIA